MKNIDVHDALHVQATDNDACDVSHRRLAELDYWAFNSPIQDRGC